MLSILSFKQFGDPKGMQKKRNAKEKMQNKRMQVKSTLNITVTLNANCSCQQNQEKRPTQHYLYFESTFKKWS